MDEEVRKLKAELALLKLQFSERLGAVETRLDSLIAQDNQQAELHGHLSEYDEDTCIQHQDKEPVKVSSALIPESTDKYLELDHPIDTPPVSSFISIFFQTILSAFFDWLAPITNIYQSYKARGMLGIFILTLVGIGLTLAGFGYLMQLLIDQLGVGAKSLLMCIAAVLVMGIGIGLKVKTRFSEFATAIVTLGVLLSYSTVYFSGSVYGLLPDVTILLLYLLIALICHWLAYWLDTKVVAGLGIIGIATMPILSGTNQFEPLYYLLSLVFVTCSSLVLAYRYLGQWLVNLSLAFSVVALEWVIGVDNVQVSARMLELFYLLFFSYAMLSLYRDDKPARQILIFLAALIGSTLLLFYQASNLFSTQMSLCFSLNALAAAAVATIFYKIRHQLTHFLVVIFALWGVLTIVSAMSQAYWGMAWAVEGLLLVYIGRRYVIPSVINQGQVLTALALIYSWSALAAYFPLPALKSVDGWLISMVIVAVIACWQRMINHSDVFDELAQNKVKPCLQLLELVWLSVLLIVSSDIWLGNWTGAIVVLIQLALLVRAKQCRQVSIEILSAALILVPLFYAYRGSLMVDSYRFTLLPLFAKFSVISAFLQLWLWSAFYRKYQPDSALKPVAEFARIVFYMLIPICWVGTVVRRLDENALMLLWLSPLLALLISRKIKHHLLLAEAKILTGLASLAFLISVGQLTFLNSLIALAGFCLLYGLAYVFNHRAASDESQFICSWGIISLGFALPNIIGFQSYSLFYGVLAAALYWSLALNMTRVSAHLKRNEIFIMAVNLLLVIVSWSLTSSNASYAAIPLIFLIAALYRKNIGFGTTRLGKYLGQNLDLFLHSVTAISYLMLFVALSEYRMDLLIAPVLAVHGALILFLKDRRITTVKYSFGLILLGIVKLAMVDAANALLWQKVILFMGIGVFILAASFWYQKLVARAEVSNA